MNGPEDTGFWVGPLAAPDSYRLVSLIGSGGEGEVWEAILPLSTAGRRTVAVKILPPCVDPADEVRWLSHGHLLRSLAHPGLVRVTDHFVGAARHRAGTVAAGEMPSLLAEDQYPVEQTRPPGATGGCRYVVMDLAAGVTLREWIVDNPDARPSARLRLLAGVAAALDEMHSGRQTGMPVAHGDVKPGNIIVGTDGAAVLVDLGLTRLADGPAMLGRSRPYAAPELRGGGQSSVLADRFAFYATAAHLLTGETPPVARSTDVDLIALKARLAAAPATATRPALAAGILSALSVPPDERPGPLSPWLQSLTDTLSQRTDNGPLPPAIHHAAWPAPAGTSRSPMRRRGVLAAAAAGVLLIAGAGGAAGLTLASHSSKKSAAHVVKSDGTHAETVGGGAHTWTGYTSADGTEGPLIEAFDTVQISCRLSGFQVPDGDTWWYRIASSPWNNRYYVSADAFYNNGKTSGSLRQTPFFDPAVPSC